jgi:2-oxoisovalerate dehydrogenase E2 component (dihydrolipoyl transacylase)
MTLYQLERYTSSGSLRPAVVLTYRQALCDIEVDDTKYPDNSASPAPPEATPTKPLAAKSEGITERITDVNEPQPKSVEEILAPRSKHSTLATPAVRGLLKELKVDIRDVAGTGKDGRVMKEDVYRYVAERDSQEATDKSVATAGLPRADTPQTETVIPLTPIQSQMFKTMTRSLSIPHFLYAEEFNIGTLSSLRKMLAAHPTQPQKLSYLPFIIKAVSLSLSQYPLLNARVDATTDPAKPTLIMRSNHNIGVAMDTPTGLLVPNIKNVQSLSVLEIAAEISRLNLLARSGKLTPTDLNGGTITVSNIGSIGGTYVAPLIVPSEVAILGVGKAITIPVFDEEGNVVKGERMSFSWSADHRVVDGATMARMASKVREFVEAPEKMMLAMR